MVQKITAASNRSTERRQGQRLHPHARRALRVSFFGWRTCPLHPHARGPLLPDFAERAPVFVRQPWSPARENAIGVGRSLCAAADVSLRPARNGKRVPPEKGHAPSRKAPLFLTGQRHDTPSPVVAAPCPPAEQSFFGCHGGISPRPAPAEPKATSFPRETAKAPAPPLAEQRRRSRCMGAPA